jgi:flagellar protein FlbD
MDQHARVILVLFRGHSSVDEEYLVIQLSRLNGVTFYLNAEMIQAVEATPDTVITLTSHDKMVVKEPVDLVIERMIDYQRQIRQWSGRNPRPSKQAGD